MASTGSTRSAESTAPQGEGHAGALVDDRRPAHGWSRLFVVVIAVFGAVLLVPAARDLVRDPAAGALVHSLNAVAGALYLLLAVCVAHNGRRMRIIGWMSVSALLTCDILIGLLTSVGAAPVLDHCAWARFGLSMAFLPLLLPAASLAWLWMSDPRRIVVAAEHLNDLRELRR